MSLWVSLVKYTSDGSAMRRISTLLSNYKLWEIKGLNSLVTEA